MHNKDFASLTYVHEQKGKRERSLSYKLLLFHSTRVELSKGEEEQGNVGIKYARVSINKLGFKLFSLLNVW